MDPLTLGYQQVNTLNGYIIPILDEDNLATGPAGIPPVTGPIATLPSAQSIIAGRV
jgi:hypothetical protein